MLGNINHSSLILDELYSMMDDYETEGLDLYNFGLTNAITDYLADMRDVQFQLCCSEWPNEEGGVCAISFIDNGELHMIMFDYKY